MPALPTLRFFSIDLMINLLCRACGVDCADGACCGFRFMPGPLLLFLFLAGTSLKPSRLIPVAVIAAHVSLMAALLGGCSWSVVSLSLLPGVGLTGYWWVVLGAGCAGGGCGFRGLCKICTLLLGGSGGGGWMMLHGFLPFIILFSICRSRSSNLVSMSAISATMILCVMGASSTSCGTPVGGGMEMVVVEVRWVSGRGLPLLSWEEEEGGEMVYLSALAFPLLTLVGPVFGCVGVMGVNLPESVPGMVEGYSVGGWEENLTLLCSGVLGSWVV